MKLTNRQIQLLQLIIETYTTTATPIASNDIKNKFFHDLSSATIRNEMVVLEKNKLIEKGYDTAGRIPTTAGYRYYNDNILQPRLTNDIKTRLQKIFANRDLSIDSIISQSVDYINETFKLPTLVTSDASDLLKRFDLVKINEHEALIIVVTSSGTIIKNQIHIENSKQFDDVSICMRVFNDRLVDTPINQVHTKLASIKEIIKSIVKEYEFCIMKIIEKIFDFKQIGKKTDVKGTKFLLAQPEFHDINKLNQVLTFLEDTNVWKHLAFNQEKYGKTSITFGEDFGKKDIAIASTTIKIDHNANKQIAVIGPTRMNYDKINAILEFIRNEIEKNIENK